MPMLPIDPPGRRLGKGNRMKAAVVLMPFLVAVANSLAAVPARGDIPRGQEKARRLPATVAQALRLDQDAEDCVAQDPGTTGCLVTVEAFNRALEHREIPWPDSDPEIRTQSGIDAIRGEVLRHILEEKYFSDAPIPARDRDSLSALAEATLFERNQAARADLGDSVLRAAYRELFPTVFQGREETRFEVLASTDSLRLASLLSASDSHARRGWQIVPQAELPAEALRAARAVDPGNLVGPVRIPYGHMVLRQVSRRKLPDVPMDAALPLLISWASLPAGGEPGWEREMEAYFKQYPDIFTTPDTLTYRAWLLPETGPKAASRRLDRERLRRDTANHLSATVAELDLPPRLRADLDKIPPRRRGEVLGPLSSVFGTWYLLALEVRKGGRRMAFEESRPLLRKTLYGREGPDFLVPALADAQARERDVRTAITAQYLMTRKPDGMASGTAAAVAHPQEAGKEATEVPWESRRKDWMRNYLVLRYVALPESGAFRPSAASAPLPDSSWSDGVENARSP